MSALSTILQTDSLTGLSVGVECCDEAIGAGLASALAAHGARIEMFGRDPVALNEQHAAIGARWQGAPIRVEDDPWPGAGGLSSDALIRMFSRPTLAGNSAPSVRRAEAMVRICTIAEVAEHRRRAACHAPMAAEIWIIAGARLEDCAILEEQILRAPDRASLVHVIAVSAGAEGRNWGLLVNLSPHESDALAALIVRLLSPAGRGAAGRCFWLGSETRL